ncbi:TonB-dependent receptor [Spongiibacter nanhainus]|uniref:TonB-dependent receptor n=1 Tax=Spongiibacter nanhainus TaxID=2794344 RepID=A0A7T4QZ49_9GAMM|nr:TonB-dependent receptor [Spongiibacter nanhainus]QQD17354.1 TonB-dependent receptor [Spongiibacter nanhainus]
MSLKLSRIASAVAVAVAGTAGAQVPVLAQGFAIEEVVVTARKKEETLQDVPVAVTSMSSEDLKALNLSDTQDLGSFSPGVHIEPAPGQGGSIAKVTIRGQVQTDNLITLDPSVGWYIDDVYLARAYGTANSLFDVSRIEVLKGPQGTLYGRNTTGGAIKILTEKADPMAELNGYVTAGVGNYNSRKVGGAINVPVIPNVLAVRVVAQKDERKDGFGEITVYDRFTQSPTGETEDVGTRDNEVYRVGVTYHPTDALRLMFTYEQNKSYMTMASRNRSHQPGFTGDEPTPPGYFPLQRSSGDFYDSAANYGNYSDADADTLALTLEYDISNNLQTKLVYGNRDVDTAYMSDVDGTGAPVSQFSFPFEQVAEQDSIEWQLSGLAFDGFLDWIAGLYYFEEDGFDLSRSGGLSTYQNGVDYNYSLGEAENKSQSAFVSGTFMLSETVNATLGVRVTEDEKAFFSQQYAVPLGGPDPGPSTAACRIDSGNPPPNADFNQCTWSDSETYEFISWTASVDWRFDEDVMAYAKTASSSRSGGQNARGLDQATSEPFEEETATDIEIGVKSELFDNSVKLNAAYYHTFYEDTQQTNLVNTPSGLITQVVNAGDADIDGIEVDAQWVITPNWMLTVTAGYLDWSFDKPDTGTTPILPSAPEFEGTARLNYFLPTAIGDWTMDLNVSSRSKMLGNISSGQAGIDAFPAATTESVTLFGARAQLDVKDTNLNVSFWVRNLTDEEYSTTGLNLFFPGSLAIANQPLGEPRTFGLDLTYNF